MHPCVVVFNISINVTPIVPSVDHLGATYTHGCRIRGHMQWFQPGKNWLSSYISLVSVMTMFVPPTCCVIISK